MATSAQYLTEYEKAQKRYQDLVSGQNKFTELVKQKLGEKTDYNRDLITQQNQLAENQLSLPSQLRSEFSTGPVRNPLQQEALIQSRQSALGSSVGSVADLLAARGQREQDILSSGANVYGNMLQEAGTAAENAWRLYQDRLAQEQAAAGYGFGGGFGGGMGGAGVAGTPEEFAIEIGDGKSDNAKVKDALGRIQVATGRPAGTGNFLQRNVIDPLALLTQEFGPTLRTGISELFSSSKGKSVPQMLKSWANMLRK